MAKLFKNLEKIENPKNIVLIDFGNKIKKNENFLKYFDLSPKKDIKEAMLNLYDILRQAEEVKNCQLILIRDI